MIKWSATIECLKSLRIAHENIIYLFCNHIYHKIISCKIYYLYVWCKLIFLLHEKKNYYYYSEYWLSPHYPYFHMGIHYYCHNHKIELLCVTNFSVYIKLSKSIRSNPCIRVRWANTLPPLIGHDLILFGESIPNLDSRIT